MLSPYAAVFASIGLRQFVRTLQRPVAPYACFPETPAQRQPICAGTRRRHPGLPALRSLASQKEIARPPKLVPVSVRCSGIPCREPGSLPGDGCRERGDGCVVAGERRGGGGATLEAARRLWGRRACLAVLAADWMKRCARGRWRRRKGGAVATEGGREVFRFHAMRAALRRERWQGVVCQIHGGGGGRVIGPAMLWPTDGADPSRSSASVSPGIQRAGQVPRRRALASRHIPRMPDMTGKKWRSKKDKAQTSKA